MKKLLLFINTIPIENGKIQFQLRTSVRHTCKTISFLFVNVNAIELALKLSFRTAHEYRNHGEIIIPFLLKIASNCIGIDIFIFQSINEWIGFDIYWILPFGLISVIWMGNINFENHIWTTSFRLWLITVVLQKQNRMNCDARCMQTICLHFALKYSYIVWSIFCEWFNYYNSANIRAESKFTSNARNFIKFVALLLLCLKYRLFRPFSALFNIYIDGTPTSHG